MTVISGPAAASAAKPQKTGFASLGASDFLKLMTEQLKQQDPFQPVDNTAMLAQMAQFSSLSGINDMGSTLKEISAKLDAIAAAQQGANPTSNPA